MTTADASPNTTAAPPKELPYPPSWLDRLQDRVDRTGIPAWIFYLLLWALTTAIALLLQWRGPNEPVAINQSEIVLSVTIVYVFVIVHYNQKLAGQSFDLFRSALVEMSSEQYAQLRYRLTHLPARSVWLATLAGIGFALLNFLTTPAALWSQLYDFENYPLLAIYKAVSPFLGISLALFLLNIYHQSTIIGTILSQHTKINVFEQQSLYTISGVSGRLALELVGLYLLFLLWYLTDPLFSANSFTTLIGIGYVAAMSFLLIRPMFGIHRLLQAEKSRLIAECSLHIQMMIGKLHSRIEADDMAQLDGVDKGLSSLELELQLLRRIPTWPWPPETLRWLVAALLFPLIIWLIQRILERILQP